MAGGGGATMAGGGGGSWEGDRVETVGGDGGGAGGDGEGRRRQLVAAAGGPLLRQCGGTAHLSVRGSVRQGTGVAHPGGTSGVLFPFQALA